MINHSTPSNPITPAITAPNELLSAVAAFAGSRFPSTTEAFQACLATVARLVGVRSAFISRLDSQVMQLLDVWEDDGCGFTAGAVVPLEDTFCQMVRATSEPFVVEDATKDIRVRNLATRTQFGIGAYLGVPIMLDNGAVYGTLCLLDPDPRPFTADQVAALTILAAHLAGFIEREVMRTAVQRVEQETTQDLSAALTSLDNQTLLVRAIVHDLRSPLTSVRGYNDLLRQGLYGSVNADQANALGSIHNAVEMMSRLVTDLLDAAAVETQTISLLNENYDPGSLVLRVIDMCSTQASRHQSELIAEVSSNLPTAVGDPMRVEQVLINLVHNALAHSDASVVTLSVDQQDDRIKYIVSDSGPGIPEERQAQIWDQYQRYGKGPGLGLGLYIVRRLTEAMGGTIELESRPTAGTQFSVYLPQQGERPKRVTL